MSDSIDPLFGFSSKVGPLYGTEDFAIWLYALIRMHRPDRVLELGTGTGVATFWIARALRDNGNGQVLTIDDGSHWAGLRSQKPLRTFLTAPDESYRDFLARKADEFGLAGQIEFMSTKLPPYPRFDAPLDLLFSDYQHDPHAIIQLLRHFLPMMAPVSSILIDSASTFLPSYLLLERLAAEFNAGTVPMELTRGLREDRAEELCRRVRDSRYTLVHLTEAKDRDQNSTAWLKIEPRDILPYPLGRMR